jgi:uncharacterized protein YycO
MDQKLDPPRGPPLEPGCVLLFSGLTALEHRIQEILANLWTRCALIVPGPSGATVVLQATSRPISADITEQRLRTGVQIVAVDDVLTHFDGYVGFRTIRPALSQAQKGLLAAFALEKLGMPFNFSPYDALRAARRRNRHGDGTSYYCAELVAAALQHAGVLAQPPLGRSASNYVPGDFAEPSQDLCLIGGHELVHQQVVRSPITFLVN